MSSKLKIAGARVAHLLLKPEFRPIETRIARGAGLAVLAWLGVKYGA